MKSIKENYKALVYNPDVAVTTNISGAGRSIQAKEAVYSYALEQMIRMIWFIQL